MSLERDLEELDKLLASRGWQIIKQTLENDILGAAIGMASSARMSNDEMHFRRGSIYATNNFKNLAENLRNQLAGEVAIKKRPAKAGRTE